MSSSQSGSLKARLKRALQSQPVLWDIYWRAKQELVRVALLRYYIYDIRHTYRAMHWPTGHKARQTLSSALLFQYHKLEKGLVMPGKRRFFGAEPADATMKMLNRWQAMDYDRNDPVYVGAIEALRGYRDRLHASALDPDDRIVSRLDSFLSRCHEAYAALSTPRKLPNVQVGNCSAAEAFRALAEARRSVRDFLPDPVPEAVLREAIRIAQLSPSACNRQPWRVYLVTDAERKQQLLSYQNGNRGFGHLAPHIAIVTADEQCFFDASERHEPYVDGGLFSMSFILALSAEGVGSCCLNWCVPPVKDKSVHRLFDLPASQRIVMLIAIGYAPEECMVPRSPRRDSNAVLISL